MNFAPRFPDVQKTRFPGFDRSWPFLVIILIGLTSSTPDLFPKAFEITIKEAGESSRQEAKIDQACEKSSCQTSFTTDLDSSHIIRVLERKEGAPYFWELGSYHIGAQGREENTSNASHIAQKVQKMEEEWPLLKYNLEKNRRPLSYILVSANNRWHTTYEMLNKSLETIKASLVNLFHKARPTESPTQESLREILFKKNWESLVLRIHNEVANLEEVLLNHEARSGQHEERSSYTLIVQVFQLINWLQQNNLFEKNSFEEWIHKKPIWELLINHIADVSGDKQFLDLDLRERLTKSESTQHLSTVFKLLRKCSWRDIEFRCLQRKIVFAKQEHYIDRPIPELMEIANDFDVFGTEYTDSAQDEKKRANVKGLIRLMNDLNLGNLGCHLYLTCGILYDLISFISKYHTELFKASFENSKRAHNFSLKLYVLDSAIQWLKSARDVKFIGLYGLWTTEFELGDPHYGTSIVNASQFQIRQNIDSSHFNDISNCYFEKDFDRLKKLFEELSEQRSSRRSIESLCVNSTYQYKDFPDLFGTNFELRTGVLRASIQKESTTSIERRFSSLFITEVFTWVENLNFLLQRFKTRQVIFEKALKILLDEKDDPIPQFLKNWLKDSSFPEEVSKKIVEIVGEDKENKLDFKDWIHHSIIPNCIYQEIVNCVSIVENSWNKIEEKLKLLNGYILLQTHEIPPVKPDEGLIESESMIQGYFSTRPIKRLKNDQSEKHISTSGVQTQSGFIIPKLLSTDSIPLYFFHWLKKIIES